MVYDPFNVLLYSVCQYFVEDFCIYVHQHYWPVIFLLCVVLVWFLYQGDIDLIEGVKKHSVFFNFLEEFEKDCINSSLNIW